MSNQFIRIQPCKYILSLPGDVFLVSLYGLGQYSPHDPKVHFFVANLCWIIWWLVFCLRFCLSTSSFLFEVCPSTSSLFISLFLVYSIVKYLKIEKISGYICFARWCIRYDKLVILLQLDWDALIFLIFFYVLMIFYVTNSYQENLESTWTNNLSVLLISTWTNYLTVLA